MLGWTIELLIAKRLGVPCAAISAPIRVQDIPARYSSEMGFEGANVMFYSWVYPLMMCLEKHLIGMFPGYAEFHQDAAPSHFGGHSAKAAVAAFSASSRYPYRCRKNRSKYFDDRKTRKSSSRDPGRLDP